MSGDYPTIVIYGTSGHARVVKEILSLKNIPVAGFLDPRPEKKGKLFLKRPVFGSIEILNSVKVPFDAAVIAVEDCFERAKIHSIFEKHNIPILSAIHPSSIISPSVKLGPGSVIGAGVVIGRGAVLGKSVIVNSGALVDFDSKLGDFSQIAPGATICGEVIVNPLSFIGAGATVIEKLSIGRSAMIGAGAVVISDIPENVLALGVPANIIDSWPERGTLLDQG